MLIRSDLLDAMARFRACIVLARDRIVVIKAGAADHARRLLNISAANAAVRDSIELMRIAELARRTLRLVDSIDRLGVAQGAAAASAEL